VLVVRPAASPIGLFLLLYGSLSVFDGITLSHNATTDSITIEEEATTNIDQNGRQFQIKLSKPVKKTKSNGHLLFLTMRSQPDEHHRDLSLKKVGRFQQGAGCETSS
jgi:hypothetical protein